MGSIATLETLFFFCRFLHDIVFHLVILAIFVFATCSGLQFPATIKALTNFLADLLRRCKRRPFRFLDLPPDIVYDHHFMRYATSEYWNIRRGKKMLPDAILNVNRQVYEEAAHALYSRTSISVAIRNVASLHDDNRPFAGVIRRASGALEHVPIVLRWSQVYNKSKKHNRHRRSIKELQADTIVRISLAELRSTSPSSWKPLLPAKDRIVGLLTSLRVIRYANPGIAIKMRQDWQNSSRGVRCNMLA